MPMPTFWDLLDRVKDETGTRESWILKRADLNHGAFTAWRKRGIPVLPPRRQLLLLAHAMRVDYEFLIEVILHDAGYLPADVALRGEAERRRDLNRGDPLGQDPVEAAVRQELGTGEPAPTRKGRSRDTA